MKKEKIAKLVITIVALILVAFIFLAGKVSYSLGEEYLEVGATLSGKSKIAFQDMDKLELREEIEEGTRAFGVSSIKFLGGSFTNDEFGKYKLYKYKDVDEIIIVYTDKSIVAFNLDTEEKTESLYKELQGRID